MKGKIRRLLSAVLAVAVAVPMTIAASAATTYSVDVTSGKMYLLNGSRTAKTYNLENSDLRVMLSTKNNTLIGFTKSGTNKETNVSLGAQKSVQISGRLNSLTVSPSFPADRTVTVSGTVGTLTVNSAAQVILADTARVSNLKVTHKSATVVGRSGSEAVNVTSVSGASVTGVSKVSKLSGSGTTSTSRPTSSSSGSSSSSRGKIGTYVDAEERSGSSYTSSIDFNGDTLYLEGKSGVKLGTAMKDVKLTVYREDTDDKIAGTWKWVQSGASTTAKSGKYDYRFTPTNSTAYKTVTLTVQFTGNESSSSSLGKPSLSFEDKSHGDGDFDIRVGIPYGLGDDAKLIIYVDGEEYDTYWLDEGDEGDDETYSVKVHGDSGDKFKIKVKVQRIRYNSDDEERTGTSKTSRTITYEID